jgi:DNA repair protein RecO (recombination protein O)
MTSAASEKVIILSRILYQDSDFVITALNSRGAQESLFARGAAKSKKRFAGGLLEPSHYVELNFESRSHSGLKVIKEATLLDGFAGLRSSYNKLSLAFKALKWSQEFSKAEGLDNHRLFLLLGHFLKSLSDLKITDEHLLTLEIQFILKILAQEGVLEKAAWMEIYLKSKFSQVHQLEFTPNPQVYQQTKYLMNSFREMNGFKLSGEEP